MEQVDDATLTKFLIRCFSGIFEKALKQVPKPTIPGSRQFYAKENGLIYLETSSGNKARSKTDVLVMREADNRHLWGMSIMTVVDTAMLEKIGLPFLELRQFLLNARQLSLLSTLDAIERGDHFCLFEIEDHEEPAAVGARGMPGTLKYSETITDNLSSFRGQEFIEFYREGIKSKYGTPYVASFQGGRLND